MYKSTDNGLTWSKLANSNTGDLERFDNYADLISKVIVNPVNGDVYFAAVARIFKSTDAGIIWNEVLSGASGSSGDVTDIVCTTSGILYAALPGTGSVGSAKDGIWQSTTGDASGWTRIANSALVPGWKTGGTYGRIVLGLAPSNQNILYVLYNNGATGVVIQADFFKYNNATTTWFDRSLNLPDEAGGNSSGNDPFAIQGGYDLAVTVKPNDENYVVVAGTNIYRSDDGFATAATTSANKIGGYANNTTYAQYTNHHSDVHALVFEPGSNLRLTSGSDGGIHVTTDVTATEVSWTSLNNNYQTYQYVYVSIDPTIGSTKYIGGAQDNGTTSNTTGTASFTMVYGGDGCATGISSGNNFHYCATQNGNIVRKTSTSGFQSGTGIKPSGETNGGIFVTLFHLDPDNTENLYYANDSRLWRTNAASTVTPEAGWEQITSVATAIGANNITIIATTRGSYTSSSNLYMGTNNAIIFRLKDPGNATVNATIDDITPTGITAGSTVIGIAVAPFHKDTVMAVISNYGVPSVFWTGNASAVTPTWVMIEGTGTNQLSIPSFRSCAIIAKKNGAATDFEYYVGTSAGLFSTVNIDGTSQTTANNTSWVKEGSGVIDQSVVSSIAVRHNDNTLLIGTHGNGMFVSSVGSVLPVTLTTFTAQKQNNNTKLQWSTSFELNTKEYIIERKYENENLFSIVSSLPAAGYSPSIKTYAFNDNAVNSYKGDIFYRLKMVDINGKFQYSNTVRIKTTKSNFITNVYPTITNGNISVTTGNEPSVKTINITISNSIGQVVFTKQLGFQNFSLNIEKLSKGNYYLKIESSDKTYSYTSQISKQ